MKNKLLKKQNVNCEPFFKHFGLIAFFSLVIVLGGLAIFNFTSLVRQFSSSPGIIELSGLFDPSSTKGIYLDKPLAVPGELLPHLAYARQVLGDSTGSDKRIYVDLGKQRLTAYEGSSLFMDVPVSTGLWGRTPTGDFRIWIKLRYTRMRGGNAALGTYYDLPNVPYTMFFSNNQIAASRGYSLHGTYWHNNFGHPMSHGCVNMRTVDAGKLFEWARPATRGSSTKATVEDPGTLITIFGVAPSN